MSRLAASSPTVPTSKRGDARGVFAITSVALKECGMDRSELLRQAVKMSDMKGLNYESK